MDTRFLYDEILPEVLHVTFQSNIQAMAWIHKGHRVALVEQMPTLHMSLFVEYIKLCPALHDVSF